MTRSLIDIQTDLADIALSNTFAEYRTIVFGKQTLIDDFIAANCTASEYLRRIGEGNLQSYVNTLLV